MSKLATGRATAVAALLVLATGAWAGTTYNITTANSIQDTIDAASDDDEIVLATGTYVQRFSFAGKAIRVRSTNPQDPATVAATIVDGNAEGSVVSFVSGEGADSILEGLTIQNGSASGGGGIHCENASPKPSSTTSSPAT